MDRAKTLICEALDADTIGLKEVNIFQFFALYVIISTLVGAKNLFRSSSGTFS